MDLNKGVEKQIRMVNGRYVMAALTYLNNKATKDELMRHFMSWTVQPRKVVGEELNRILDNGVSKGFIMKKGKNYSLPSKWNDYHVDFPEEDDSDDALSDECKSPERAKDDEEDDKDDECSKRTDEVGESSAASKVCKSVSKTDLVARYVTVFNDLFYEDTLYFCEILLNNIIDYAVGDVDAKNAKNVAVFLKEYNVSARMLKEIMGEFYSATYDLFKLKLQNLDKRNENGLRDTISEAWKLKEAFECQLSHAEQRYQSAIDAMKGYDRVNLKYQFFLFAIAEVKRVASATKDNAFDDIRINNYHNTANFKDACNEYLQLVYDICKINDSYDFMHLVNNIISSDDSGECDILEEDTSDKTASDDEDIDECVIIEKEIPIIDLDATEYADEDDDEDDEMKSNDVSECNADEVTPAISSMRPSRKRHIDDLATVSSKKKRRSREAAPVRGSYDVSKCDADEITPAISSTRISRKRHMDDPAAVSSKKKRRSKKAAPVRDSTK